MLEAMRFKHDRHLQTSAAVTGRLGHTVLLDPGNMSLRGTVQDREARRDSGLSEGYEAHSAGSLSDVFPV